MRIIITGGREFGKAVCFGQGALAEAAAERAHQQRLLFNAALKPFVYLAREIIHGAADGADFLADLWCYNNRVLAVRFPADWYPNGKLDRSAGPKRNSIMIKTSLALGPIHCCIAFEGGRGTAGCVRKAKAAGIEVYETWKGEMPR